MEVRVAVGPGSGKELITSLSTIPGMRVRHASSPEELAGADLLVTPRGPSRSFSKWYREDPVGRAVVEAHRNGTAWIALCGSGIPLAARLGAGCDGIEPLSLVAMTATNDRLFGEGTVLTTDGRRLPFHFTSAPSYEGFAGTDILGRAGGEGAILRGDDIVISSGLPLSTEGWAFLFAAAGFPVAGTQVPPR